MTAADRAYKTLRDEIIAGDCRAGERLTEEALAARLGVSRTPVRSALERLDAEGFITWERHRSAVVRVWSAADARQVLEVRALLESAAAGRAARNARPGDIARLEALCDEMECMARSEDGNPAITLVNKQFHSELLRMAGNDRLTEIATNLMDVALLIQTYTAFSHADLRRSHRQHREIVAAVAAGESDWAAATMKAHILAAIAIYAEAVRHP